MISIRKKQVQVFQNMTIFEQQILCHQLPNSIHRIKIPNSDKAFHENASDKSIQDFKRRILNIELEKYELSIQQYEYEFEQEFTAFQSETSKTNSLCQMSQWNMFMHIIQTYLYHNTNILICQVRYKESCLHMKLLRNSRQQRLSTQKNIDVYPQIIVDIPKVSLNSMQLNYLSHTGK